jgi:toxin FitB
MSLLIDTNVISELRKGERCDPQVSAWFSAVPDDSIYLSVLVIGEIRRGIERIRLRDLDSARALERWLARVIRDNGDRIIDVDRDVAEEWGRLNAPDPLPAIDGLLAATAIVHGFTLVTRNTKDVERTGVTVVNPFEESD